MNISSSQRRAVGHASRPAGLPADRHGLATPLAFALILLVAAVAGAFYFAQREDVEPSPSDEAMMEEDGDAMTEDKDSQMMEDQEDAMFEGQSFAGSGERLAGSVTPLLDFESEDYELALAQGRTIFLYFYANWCPICTAELPRMYAGFDAVDRPGIVGFRVNYNDNETDDAEEQLARQFGIAYQHTKVIVKNGQQVLKDGSTWDTDRYIEELSKF